MRRGWYHGYAAKADDLERKGRRTLRQAGLCTTGKERRITRWEDEHILEAVQRRLNEHPEKMRHGQTSARAVQSSPLADPGHEHHGHSAAHGRDEGLAKPEKRLLNATRPKLLRFDTSGKVLLHNQDPKRT